MVKMNVKIMVNVFKIVQIVHRDQYVCVSHVSMAGDVNLVVTYPSALQFYNSFMYTFHFCGPFLINLISTIILIVKKSRQQSIIHKQQPYKEILREQFQQHKYLLVAPVVLIILALPRLIIASVSKCMKSSDDSWLFAVGYFISFLPPMLTFVIFIVPSEFYKKEFKKSIQQFLK
jgi:hypothetical protein